MDDAAYIALMARILSARTTDDLLSLVSDILAFTHGHPTLDFAETWNRRWRTLAGRTPVPDGIWP